MKTKTCLYPQPNSLIPRTAIEREQKQFIQIAFAVHLSAAISAERYRSDSVALKSAVLHFVFFMIIINKMQQSAAQSCSRTFELRVLPFGKTSGAKLLNFISCHLSEVFPLTVGSGKTMAFENRHVGCKEREKINRRRIFDTLRINFFETTQQTACIFSKEYYRYDANGYITAEKDGPFTEKEEFTFTYSYFAEHDVYGVDYGFDLEPPEDDPANLEVGTTSTTPTGGYRRDYTWNERNLLIKSDDKLNTVIYRYGDDGRRALKFTQQSNSETLYFNNFYSVHQVAHEPNHEHGLRVSKHIFVGNSRLVTAMTHADNHGDTTEQTEKRYYYHADHLQSAQFITNAKGEQYEHIEYTPYGELWIEETAPGIDKLPFRFTGKELDEETGLYYYGARYLDPKYSRWLSGDPALNDYIPKAPIDEEAKKHNENLPGMGGIYNTVNLHVYHYAGNNPVKYIDPDGETFIDDAINFLKGWINYEVDKGQSLFTNNTSFVPDPTYEAFNDILRSIDNFSKATFQDHKFIDESIGKSGTDDEFLKAMYVASGADLRITQGQFNLNAEMGVVNAEGVLNIRGGTKSNFGISLSGGASSFTGETALGLKDSSLTASIGASMLEYKGAINLKIGDMKVRLKGSFFIGGLGAGASLGPRMEFKLAAGIGGGIGLEFRKIEE
ncbi:RHS repeat domain-containing protein [Treponema putidum]|uniref:RHS repeat domain-containing protein n=1 Tax=Treponema putidum TaxID=221027 RepID=UPI002105A6FD|nr:RHS repeat-associated core domain-containing protein [Treponema putidum]